MIRIAKDEADSRTASAIYAKSWKAGYRGIFSDKLLDDIPLDFWVTTFNGNYETGRFQIAIMSVNGQDVGAGGYGLSREYPDPAVGEITSIYFLNTAWGKGYARELMDFMLGRLKEMGCKKAHIWVLEENTRARRFYEKCGLTLSGNGKNITFKGESKREIEYEIEVCR